MTTKIDYLPYGNPFSKYLDSILVTCSISLLGLYVRLDGINARQLVLLLLLILSSSLFSLSISFMIRSFQITKQIFSLGAILILIAGLYSTGYSSAEIGFQITLSIILGSLLALIWTIRRSSLVVPILLLGFFLISPSVLWPRLVSINTLLFTYLILSVVLGFYSLIFANEHSGVICRVFIYCCWLTLLVYIPINLNLVIGQAFLGMIIGAYIFANVARNIERRVASKNWMRSKFTDWNLRWWLEKNDSQNERQKLIVRNDLPSTYKKNIANLSVIDTSLWLTGQSTNLLITLKSIVDRFEKEFLYKEVIAHPIALEAFFDLPSSITNRAVFLHLQQILWSEVLNNLPIETGSERFDKHFFSTTWPNYLAGLNLVLTKLNEEGELNRRLQAFPNQKIIPPVSPNGLFLDYGRWHDGKPIVDFRVEFKDELSPEEFFDPNSVDLSLMKEFLDWVNGIKDLRNSIIDAINDRDTDEKWQRALDRFKDFGKKGFLESLGLIEMLRENNFLFEAIDISETLKKCYPAEFTRKKIDEEIARCEIRHLLKNGRTNSVELQTNEKFINSSNDAHLCISNQTREKIKFSEGEVLTPGIKLHILVDGVLINRFELNPDEMKTISISPGFFNIFVIPYGSITPIVTDISFEDTHSYKHMSMHLAVQ